MKTKDKELIASVAAAVAILALFVGVKYGELRENGTSAFIVFLCLIQIYTVGKIKTIEQ